MKGSEAKNRNLSLRSALLYLILLLLIIVATTSFYMINSQVSYFTYSLSKSDETPRIRVYEEQLNHLRSEKQELESKITALTAEGKTPTELKVPRKSSPTSSELQELIYRHNTRYWTESQSDWPSHPIPPMSKYVTFSPWKGGFNNIRMSLEMAAAAAFAFNRTLVMPPAYKMYLRGASSLESYFDYSALQVGVSVIKYEEFLVRVPEFRKRQGSDLPSERMHSSVERYFRGLREMPGVLIHDEKVWGKHQIAGNVVYCVPTCPGENENIRKSPKAKIIKDWFENFKKWRTLTYNYKDMEHYQIIHFPQDLLGHFYSMFWFEDPQKLRQMRRLIRDHVHFKEDIIEYAERVIKRLGDFKYSCLHIRYSRDLFYEFISIRRNEFQFKDVWTPAEQIVENVKGLFKPGEDIYISTDELSKGEDKKNFDPTAMAKKREHTWFTPMINEWGMAKVHFLDEYFDELLGESVPEIWIGCIETVICTRARVFVGTRKSTFSGYIHRLRGYMHDVGQKMILDAQAKYPEDYLYAFRGPSWSLFPSGAYSGGHPYWGREYNEAWEGVYDPI